MTRKTALKLVQEELDRAQSQHGPFNSEHEGYAVLLEEVDELWDEIKAGNGTSHRGTSEAIQAAAMALRYLIDLCDEERAGEHKRKVKAHEKKVVTYTPRWSGSGYSG